ncbi:MAG: hypothetical protein JNJ55_00895 [Betaproteobacteria bacterium]|nr:hypothetical protein [Betaproteobacteria bacterium]
MRRWISALAIALTSGVCFAGSTSGAFKVNVELRRADGLCVSQALSASTNALVRVACRNGQFVDISPVPGRPFAGVHGGAYRFFFTGVDGLTGLTGDADFSGMGTITAMRIYHVGGDDGPLEMLVSF